MYLLLITKFAHDNAERIQNIHSSLTYKNIADEEYEPSIFAKIKNVVSPQIGALLRMWIQGRVRTSSKNVFKISKLVTQSISISC